MSERWKITTLGTSHGDPTSTRFNVSTLLSSSDGEYYLLDAGSPALALLLRKGVDPCAVRSIFITHLHQDHYGSVPDFLKYWPKRSSREQRYDIWLPELEAAACFNAFAALSHRTVPPEKVRYREMAPFKLVETGSLRMTFIPTDHFSNEHLNFPSYALYAELADKKVLFTGDLAADLHDLPDHYPADLMFCELTHYFLEKQLPRFQKLPIKKLVFTHIGNEWQKADVPERLEAIRQQLPYPVVIAGDGDEFEV